jgi:hypothetical protein
VSIVATVPSALTLAIFEPAVIRVPATVSPTSPWLNVPAVAEVSVFAVVATVMVLVMARLPWNALLDL